MNSEEVIELVCDTMGLDKNMVLGQCRNRELVQAREIISYILCKLLKYTTTKAGKAINRNHSTIIHYIKQYETDYRYDKDFSIFAIKALGEYGKRLRPKGFIRGFKLFRTF